MPKKPLITRTELRKLREQDNPKKRNDFQEEVADSHESLQRESTVSKESFFNLRKPTTKEKQPITRSRRIENSKVKERSNSLNKAILLVIVLLAVLFYAVFNF
ncbi:cell wall synthase accessory phosphoprotein MacP [Vagococcus entomophilus]|uniref:Uncharacterized protein n=1 Tax=Vagococcus entomophilus TaxID=1160095 RepID=A0A430AID7_9ENTE|nr:cell wall synthase accessory phosphoprotein MacP [Vagococcus entomophilus]RSU07754.1 hypothetical protein CBF30_00500 [Vagococcus entomophilus]